MCHFYFTEVFMIYRLGTGREVLSLREKLLPDVYDELAYQLAILDSNYGADRDYYESGGYAVVAETDADLLAVKAQIIDYENYPCEWSSQLNDSGYIFAIYVLNDDYSLSLFMPKVITPQEILDVCV
jgi:hypothetical protein